MLSTVTLVYLLQGNAKWERLTAGFRSVRIHGHGAERSGGL